MLILAVVLLLVVCAALGLRLYTLERDIRQCAKQLREGRSPRVTMAAPHRGAEELLTAVNGLLALRESDAAAYRRQEKAIRQQIANISHDLRTPLTSIMGSASAILENDAVLTPQQRMSLLRNVRSEAQWLIRMVENLLSITRMGDTEARISKELEAAEEVLASVAAKFQQRFPDIRLVLSAPEDPLFVPMDAILVEQVLMNLMENAAYHGHSTCIHLTAERQGKDAVFTVRDNGSGIAPELLPNIFSPTIHSQSHTSDKRRNMGIGLSVCRSIVKAHGGIMSAANAADGGAIFCFTLPLETLNTEDTINEDQG